MGIRPVITNISLVVIPPPAGAPVPERLTQPAAVAAWEAEIDKAASTGKFSGVWLWAKNGKAITSGARGKADREKGIDNTLNTRFRIGSMNKMFTAVATLQLVERGKLSLDDTHRQDPARLSERQCGVQGKDPAPVVAHGRHG